MELSVSTGLYKLAEARLAPAPLTSRLLSGGANNPGKYFPSSLQKLGYPPLEEGADTGRETAHLYVYRFNMGHIFSIIMQDYTY